MRKTAHAAASILAYLKRDFSDVEDLFPLSEGLESQAYLFRCAGEDFVVRINKSAAGFEKDRFVAANFGSPALPIPAVLLVDRFEDDVICVSRAAAGTTLQALGDEAFGLGAAVGAILDSIEASDVSALRGAGPFDALGTGHYESWRSFLRSGEQHEWSALGLADEVAPFLDAIDRLAEQCSGELGLVHGDFGSNNVLCEGGAITGVIDWSEALVGDPLYDVANLLFWRSWLACMEQQCRYFEANEPHRLANAERLACYQLHIGLAVVLDAARDGDEKTLRWALNRCREVLA